MNRILYGFPLSVFSIGVFLTTHSLQSDGISAGNDIDVKCIGRIKFYEPLLLINPVKGGSESSIGSVWGDKRDQGKRTHEGMDIFAPRGTAILAPVDGVVTRTGWDQLGGRVLWLESRKTQHSYYFAHLATFNVCVGDKISQGQVVGTIGTTGNARFTRPHLHFGIYTMDRKSAMNREVVWREG